MADETLTLFPFVLTAPDVSENYPDQRWFSHGESRVERNRCSVGVFRSARCDTVQLEISYFARDGAADFRSNVNLTADELRKVAAQLLSAAHDLDCNPSSTLK